MISATAQVVVVYLALVAALAVAGAIGVRCSGAVRTGVIVAEVLLLLLVALEAIAWLRGHEPAEPATHLGYVAVAVVLLPVLVGRRVLPVEGGEDGPERADYLIAAIACASLVVVVLRMQAT